MRLLYSQLVILMNRSPVRLPLDQKVFDSVPRADIPQYLQGLFGSVRFSVAEDDCECILEGPDTQYHTIDPYLPSILQRLGISHDTQAIYGFREMRQQYSFCLEDVWSGYTIVSTESLNTYDNVGIIHADDHTDLMPTILQVRDGNLWYPGSSIIFEPHSQEAWQMAIHHGVIGIGNFLTAICYLSPNIHIRHLSQASPVTDRTLGLDYDIVTHWQVPDVSFACVTRNIDENRGTAGSYRCSSNADCAFDDLPSCPIIVHIDLDYFINDFNGNPCDSNYIPDKRLRTQAQHRIDDMFSGLHQLQPYIVSWIVAASPSFCSATHWRWLCDTIAGNIRILSRSSNAQLSLGDKGCAAPKDI